MRKDVYRYWVIFTLSDGRETAIVLHGSFNEVLQNARRFASVSTKTEGVRWKILEIKRA